MGTSTFVLANSPSPGTSSSSGPYRPPQFSKEPQTSMSVTVGGNSGGDFTTPGSGVTAQTGSASQKFYFDAVIRAEHEQILVPTMHPVQTGAPISDHAYLLPARVVLEIGMSDAMASYEAGAYNGGSSKSVTAYQKFVSIQAQRQPITLNTHLNKYKNMLIQSIRAVDTNDTLYALKAIITFQQIIPATVTTTLFANTSAPNTDPSQSARPNQNIDTPAGTQITSPPSQSLINGNNVPGALTNGALSPQSLSSGTAAQTTLVNGNLAAGELVPGAGTWSSNPLNSTTMTNLSGGPN